MRRAALATAALAVLALAVWLLARPGGSGSDYASFARCPLANSATSLCLYGSARGGSIGLGKQTITLSHPIALQGGIHVRENSQREVVGYDFIAPAHGQALAPVSEPMPSGLRGVLEESRLPGGLRARLNRYLATGGAGADELYATVELATPANAIGVDIQNLIERAGVALTLPVKVRLSNPFLNSVCQPRASVSAISAASDAPAPGAAADAHLASGANPAALYTGSDGRPIVLALTTGTTRPPAPGRPISGRVAHTSIRDEYNLTAIGESRLVTNSFAVPAVHGCRGADAAAIERSLNAGLGLPARAGTNVAILQGALSDANSHAVRASR